MREAFVYLWYDALNKMYYLGVTDGQTPYYTHSSSSKQFCVIVPPSSRPIKERKEFWDKYEKGEIENVRYRILPKRFILNVTYLTENLHDYGKMCEREHILLVNRFERCWNRYYNKSLGDPRYVDLSGEKGSNYKDGSWIAEDHEQYLQNHRNYRKTPHRIAYKRKWDLDNFAKEAARLRKFSLRKKEEKLIERQGVGTLEMFLR